MSRLTELLRQARKTDPQLGADLEAEVAALLKRRQFGLVFERHQPEAVELPGRAIRRGDKVRVLPPRGETKKGDQRLWLVERVERVDGQRVGHLVEMEAEEPETQAVLCDDLVVVAEFKDRIFPGLVETGRVERGGPDKPFHTVINAENFHALEMLTYTHRGKVDAIYIDPPYNTGAKDWKYNNDYVASDDDYRHSKWLAFMERRLEIAKELLNPDDSVLIVTIDEKEYLRLGMLLEQTFPEGEIQMISSVINPGGASRENQFSRVDEYLYFVQIGASSPSKTTLRTLTMPPSKEGGDASPQRSPIWRGLLRGGSGPLRTDSPSKFYPVLVDEASGRIMGTGEPLPANASRDSVVVPPGLVAVWPLKRGGVEGRWEVNRATFSLRHSMGYIKAGPADRRTGVRTIYYLRNAEMERIESGEIIMAGRDDNGVAILAYNTEVEQSSPGKTLWNINSHNATEHGSNLVKRYLPGRKFPFPKSLYAVEDVLRFYVASKPNATVLDFFSGSGTTAHAIMRLNKQDGGRRQCISVTNNEVSAEEQQALRKKGLRPGDPDWEALGICEYITKPRITAAITGQTPEGTPVKGDYKFTDEFPMADGFEENAAFFTLTYEAPLSVRHHRAFERIAPMLWLKAGSRGRVITALGECGWDVAEAYGVVENVDQMPDFVARVEEVGTVEMVFVVTDSDAAFQNACRDLPERVTAVRLYESYLHNFTINRRAGA